MTDLITILDSENHLLVFNHLTSLLSIKDVVALTRTCRQLSSLYRKMERSGAWDIDERLRRFVKDPQEFRLRLAEVDGIISGGFALQFMDRVTWASSDLDVCIQAGEKAQAFARYLEEVEGYDLASRKVANYGWAHNDMVYQYDKEVKGQLIRLEVVMTIHHPVHSALSTYTTALVNVITGDHAYCVFPNATFMKRQTFPTRIPDFFNGVILPKKYQERGWKFNQRLPKNKETTQELDMGQRRIGDKHTWKIALPAIKQEAAVRAERVVDGLEFVTARRDDDDDVGLEWLSLTATQLV